ncbi:MAG TPA: 6-carboxytetrahydropterin synthase QueD [Waddliaceae bacterium]
MFKVEKIFRFEAGHSLKHHDGQCKDPHGHSYMLIVSVKKEALITFGPKTNMAIDFNDISQIVKPMIFNFFDHKWLNDTLKTDSPTAEFIAKWIFDYLEPKLPNLSAITIYETDTSKVTYTKVK